MKKFWKEAVVMLLVIVLVFSSVAIADIKINESKIKSITNLEGSGIGAIDDIVWDNDMSYIGAMAAQWDKTIPFDCYLADDFQFEEITEVKDVHWIGGYAEKDYQYGDFDWCISFMYDDGTGLAPDSHPKTPSFEGPFCFLWEDIEKTLLQDTGFANAYELKVDLPYNITFEPSLKYWISIWGEGEVPPQSAWAFHEYPIKLSPIVWGSNYLGFPFWTPGYDVQGFDHDVCFQLTAEPPCEPGIDVEKQVKDKNGEWVDADTENEAVDLPICENATFRIIITNTGNCALINIVIKDIMHDSLKYIGADPQPDNVVHTTPEWVMDWMIPGPLAPGEIKTIYITFHVEGPECSNDYNHVIVEGYCEECPSLIVNDEDWCWVHAYKKSKDLNMPFLQFLQAHQDLFPILQKLFRILGL
jgi:uncharacterized repeat protein (TIGR01451 family)